MRTWCIGVHSPKEALRPAKQRCKACLSMTEGCNSCAWCCGGVWAGPRILGGARKLWQVANFLVLRHLGSRGRCTALHSSNIPFSTSLPASNGIPEGAPPRRCLAAATPNYHHARKCGVKSPPGNVERHCAQQKSFAFLSLLGISGASLAMGHTPQPSYSGLHSSRCNLHPRCQTPVPDLSI